MGLSITATNAVAAGPGVWVFEMPPHQVRLFGSPSQSVGQRSVVLLKACQFSERLGSLQFDIDDAIALNVGTQPSAIAILADLEDDKKVRAAAQERPSGVVAYAPGDRQFLALTRQLLPDNMHKAAEKLLAGVRERSPGELKRGQARNFSDTPDNFWYVIVQPRVEQLSITVRGPVEHFEPMARLPIKDDRGNTLFKITGEADVPKALELIFHAKRRR
jgi:hypothetical protein